ncbi:hypothetical protein [Fimbriiglobus ruber]|uniref:hypothetical protein n=1 Tax=Fimbriiglobus ruber TaxID=1908690 RepID=UPI00117AD488|nr:hypothetical protein [Fimbriiglobus ruber]
MLPQQDQPVTDRCCHGGASQSSAPTRRGWEVAAGVVSIGVWAFLPKCPICLAAHLALWTGLGLSLTEATYLRWALLILSGVLLLGIVARRIVRRER